MDLAWLPLLRIQRDLYALPRGMERFQAYLKTLIDPEDGDLRFPLAGMNPMGKEHVPAFLDRLLGWDADGAGARALDAVQPQVAGEAGSYRVCLVVTDDLKGGWTDRGATELAYRRDQRALHRRGWLAVPLWTSETYDAAKVGAAVREAVFRAAWTAKRGYARTLGGLLRQEGFAMARAGSGPNPDADEIAYSGSVLGPLLESEDEPTLIAALFGDEAARRLGQPPLGLSPRAGLAWAYADALARGAG